MRACLLWLVVIGSLIGCRNPRNGQAEDSQTMNAAETAFSPNVGKPDEESANVFKIVTGIKNVTDVDAALTSIIEGSSKSSGPAWKLFSLLARVTQDFKSFFWRALPLYRDIKLVYVPVVEGLRSVRDNIAEEHGAHAAALMDYLIAPSNSPQFDDYSKLQAFFIDEAVKIDGYIADLKALIAPYFDGTNGKQMFVLDSSVLVGDEQAEEMASQVSRYLIVTGTHVQGLIGTLRFVQASMFYLASYNLDALNVFIDSLTQGPGTGNGSPASTLGNFVTSIGNGSFVRDEASRLGDTRGFLRLKNQDALKDQAKFSKIAPEQMKIKCPEFMLQCAYAAMVSGSIEQLAWFTGMKVQASKGNQREYLLNAGDFVRDTGRDEILFTRLKRIVTEKHLYRDYVTKREFVIDFRALFDPSRPTAKDLTLLFPEKEAYASRNESKSIDALRASDGLGLSRPRNDYKSTFGGVFPKQEHSLHLIHISLMRDSSAKLFLGPYVGLFF